MSRLHECNSSSKLNLRQKQDLDTFLVLAAKELSGAGHALCVLKTIAWLQDGSKPTPMVIKDEVLPCLKDMILFDQEGWGPVRSYVHVATKETDASLKIDLTSVGQGHTGPRAVGGLISLSSIVAGNSARAGASASPVGEGEQLPDGVATLQNLSKRRNPFGGQNGQRAKKNKQDGPKHVGPFQGAERQQVLRREHTSEELKHDGSESEVETPDPDYADDGFVVDDEEELEFDSDAASSDIPNTYELE